MAGFLSLDEDQCEQGLIDNINNSKQISETLKKTLIEIVIDPNRLQPSEKIKGPITHYAERIINDILLNKATFPERSAAYCVLADLPVIRDQDNINKTKELEDLVAAAFDIDTEKGFKVVNGNLRL